MGMYTEIIFGARLIEDLPSLVERTIRNMVDGVDLGDTTDAPDHPFFKSERTWLLRSVGSYYFSGCSEPSFQYDDVVKQYSLHFRTNIKDYDNEIEKFLDWIKPYIAQGSGLRDFYAIVTYEEDSEPTIYYLND